MNKKKRVVVVGATGHFGGRLCRRLLNESDLEIVITSRSIKSATAFTVELEKLDPKSDIRASKLDFDDKSFEADLQALHPDIVVHTAGPFQGQDYRVAKACIRCGSHYLDLADGREFTHGFKILNDAAVENGVLLVTGASTLPGLSTAVIDELRPRFKAIHRIRAVISPAHQTPPGESTLAATLGYCGKPFTVLENGKWERRFGWQDLKVQRHPDLGFRLSGACNVPDLALLPEYVPEASTVTFHASLEWKTEQLILWILSWLTRLHIVRNWNSTASFFRSVRLKFLRFGSKIGGMHIELNGTGPDDHDLTVNWYLTARQNHGPEIPCTPALVLIRKLMRGKVEKCGALPCLGLITMAEFDDEIREFDVEWTTHD